MAKQLYGAAAEYLSAQFGGSFDSPDTYPLIGTTPEKILTFSGDRVGLLVMNLSANEIHLGPTPEVSASQGMLLGPSGGSVSMSIVEDFMLPTLEWWAVAAGANSVLMVLPMKRFALNGREVS